MTCKLKTINADILPEIFWRNVRVVTTDTLASGYGCEEKSIRMNLSRNLDRFEEGKHYFMLTGAELREFKDRATQGGSVGKNARSLTLWTERGAARMSKIVDTDEAWSFFEKMEKAYFRKPVIDKPSSLQTNVLPDFDDPIAAAQAWIDAKKAERQATVYVHRQAQYIEHLENLFQPGMTPFQFCKQLNGVNVSLVNAYLADNNWLFDERSESRKAAWRVKAYARDLYLTEKRQRIDPDDMDSFDSWKPILLRKGAIWLYRHYLKGSLPMKKRWDGKLTHDTDLQEALS